MVLKKPYAFMIKHFRAIHILLLIPMIYLVAKISAILSCFNSYIINDYSLNFMEDITNISSKYLNILMYVSIIIILTIYITISILLQQKKKPNKLYNLSIIYYIIMFLLITSCFNIFEKMQLGTINELFIKTLRDLGYIFHYCQYIIIGFTIIRGSGFNLKKFNFKSDIAELEITSEDSEEFEFLVGKDTYQAKRAARRFFRELKYYYLENKFIFTVIMVIVLIICGTLIYMNREVYGKVYQANETLSFGGLTFKIKSASISSLTKSGEQLKEGKSFVIVELEITNRYREERNFNYGNLNLVINKQKSIMADLSLGNYFSDYGTPLQGSAIKGLTSNTYILVYEINKSEEKNKITLEAYSHFDTTVGGLGAVNKEISLIAKVESSNVITNNVSSGTNINLKTTNLKKTTASISNYEITNRYEYQTCKEENNCITTPVYIDYVRDYNKTLLVLDYTLGIDEESPYFYSNKDFKSFFQDFLKIKYKYNNKEYISDISVLNTENYNEKLILKVNNTINYASEIYATISIRNISYNIKLK